MVNGAGLEGLRESIRSHVAMADSLADRIAREQGFALATPPSLALVCLYLVDRDGLPDDVATKAAMEAVNVEGRSFLTHTSVNGHFAIRVAIGTPTTQPDRHPVGLAPQCRSPERCMTPELHTGSVGSGLGAGLDPVWCDVRRRPQQARAC
ncbi:hypothetical protein [Streptomyces sp. NPDC093544]|uniref:hypothetical protein n=1 Tax=Streptomyces sp. NPDC093544 TaxID=3155200 RepID=UPI003420F9AD